ncbi:hypothetical protein BaRGS_00039832 [Batillaria attramentaria]|uniref:Uncharacterized protein n=1 Tax=Batillaria attramentaria TaxID=370345 RepID=A0ABD0J2N3_9CAEN
MLVFSSDSKNESQMRKGTNGENSSDHTEPGPSHVRQMTLDPKLVLPMTSKRYRACRQATIVPVISVLGNQATLYPNKEAKFGRAITLHPKVKGRMERTSNIIAALRKTSTTHNMPPTSKAISNAFLTSSSSKGEASTSADPSSDLPLSSPSDPAAGSPVSPVMEGRSREYVSDDSAEVTLVPQVIQQLPSSARRHSHCSDSLLANRNWLTALTARGRSSQRSTFRDSRSARAAVASAGRWTGRLPQYV